MLREVYGAGPRPGWREVTRNVKKFLIDRKNNCVILFGESNEGVCGFDLLNAESGIGDLLVNSSQTELDPETNRIWLLDKAGTVHVVELTPFRAEAMFPTLKFRSIAVNNSNVFLLSNDGHSIWVYYPRSDGPDLFTQRLQSMIPLDKIAVNSDEELMCISGNSVYVVKLVDYPPYELLEVEALCQLGAFPQHIAACGNKFAFGLGDEIYIVSRRNSIAKLDLPLTAGDALSAICPGLNQETVYALSEQGGAFAVTLNENPPSVAAIFPAQKVQVIWPDDKMPIACVVSNNKEVLIEFDTHTTCCTVLLYQQVLPKRPTTETL